jgi:hypothetical protein
MKNPASTLPEVPVWAIDPFLHRPIIQVAPDDCEAKPRAAKNSDQAVFISRRW